MPTFRILHGEHFSPDPAAVAAARARNKDQPADRWVNPAERVYRARRPAVGDRPGDPDDWRGDIITVDEGPQAAFMRQDSEKFEPLRDDGTSLSSAPSAAVTDALRAENDRLRAELAAARAGAAPGTPAPAAAPPAVAPAPRNLDALSLKELQALAAEEEIDLGAARNKDEVLRAIRAAKK